MIIYQALYIIVVQKCALQLSLSASKLRDLDYFSKVSTIDYCLSWFDAVTTTSRINFEIVFLMQSDPMVIVYTKRRDGKLDELGRTEVVMNNLHPIWIEKIHVAYQFEIVQQLM